MDPEQEMNVSYSSMERNLQYIKNKTLPASPNTVEGVRLLFAKEDIMRDFGYTKHADSKPFLKKIFEGSAFSYCVFASDNVIAGLDKIEVSRRNFLMDATFKVCPYGDFKQLLVIYVEYMDKVIQQNFRNILLMKPFLGHSFHLCIDDEKN